MSEEPDDIWTKNREDTIKRLKGLKPKDRLDYYSALADITLAITQTTQGWMKWLLDPMVMNNFKEENFKTMVDEMRKVAIAYIQADINATKLFPRDTEKKLKDILKPDMRIA